MVSESFIVARQRYFKISHNTSSLLTSGLPLYLLPGAAMGLGVGHANEIPASVADTALKELGLRSASNGSGPPAAHWPPDRLAAHGAELDPPARAEQFVYGGHQPQPIAMPQLRGLEAEINVRTLLMAPHRSRFIQPHRLQLRLGWSQELNQAL